MPLEDVFKASKKTVKEYLIISICLLMVYCFWGSGYIATKICLNTSPPLYLMAIRFIGAGAIACLFGFIKKTPVSSEECRIAVISGLVLVISNTTLAYAQQYISTATVTILVATIPFWTLLISKFDSSSIPFAWRPISISFIGILVLASNQNWSFALLPIIAVLFGSIAWAKTTYWLKQKKLKFNLRILGIQMISGGLAILVTASLLEKAPIAILNKSFGFSIFYLIFGSTLIAYFAYGVLIQKASVVAITSYTFVCPLIATWLGLVVLNEVPTTNTWVALLLIVMGLIDNTIWSRNNLKTSN